MTRARRNLLWIAPAAGVGLFLWSLAQYYDSRTGFTSLIRFGDRFTARRLPAVKELPLHVDPGPGYDGQFYAQMATDPLLRDPALDQALDLAPHRARRILFSWTAFVAGMGKPARIVQAYALQNAVAWLCLGALLFRWFPPRNARLVALWFVTMFAGGLLWSVRASLLDGPSLLVIAAGMVALERSRRWLAALCFAVSGLGRETNVLAAAAQVDPLVKDWRSVGKQVSQLALVALPVAIWFDYLYSIYRSTLYTSGNNFAAPLEFFLWKWKLTLSDTVAEGWWGDSRFNVAILLSLSVQGAFMIVRPQWKDPWWRLGSAYVALMVFFGRPLWEGEPSALRVVLPLTLAFNVLLARVTRGMWFWPLLIAGNLSVLYGLHVLGVPFVSTWL